MRKVLLAIRDVSRRNQPIINTFFGLKTGSPLRASPASAMSSPSATAQTVFAPSFAAPSRVTAPLPGRRMRKSPRNRL